MDRLESAVRHAVDFVIPIVEAIGAFFIVAGVALAFGAFVLSRMRLRPTTYEHVRLLLARYIALGIEFQLASDVLNTAVSPTFEQIGRLAAIAAIRTLLNYFLAKEIERAERMEREGLLGSMGDELAPADGVAPGLVRPWWWRAGRRPRPVTRPLERRLAGHLRRVPLDLGGARP